MVGQTLVVDYIPLLVYDNLNTYIWNA